MKHVFVIDLAAELDLSRTNLFRTIKKHFRGSLYKIKRADARGAVQLASAIPVATAARVRAWYGEARALATSS